MNGGGQGSSDADKWTLDEALLTRLARAQDGLLVRHLCGQLESFGEVLDWLNRAETRDLVERRNPTLGIDEATAVEDFTWHITPAGRTQLDRIALSRHGVGEPPLE